MTAATIHSESTMEQVLEAYPGARRALFRKYHIGGCSSCGFHLSETLGDLCKRNGGISIDEAIGFIQTSHEQDLAMWLTPDEADKWIKEKPETKLMDVRSKEEHEAVAIPQSILLTRELLQKLMEQENKDEFLIFYDYNGSQVLDAAVYFFGHGFKNVKCVEGGIDLWSQKIDTNLPRYVVE